MALVQAPAQIQDPSREKTSSPSNLKKEVQTKRRVLRIDAYVAVVGSPGTGRKTLAYRLCNMADTNLGILEEVPVNYRYEGFHLQDLPPGSEINSRSAVTLTLNYYIIEPPAELPVFNPPRYWEYWNEFCSMLLCFDVRNQRSFHAAGMKLTGYREQNLRIPTCALVGNKSDRRYVLPPQPENPDDPEYLNQREILVDTARMEAQSLNAECYLECSARTKERVRNVLRFVTASALVLWFYG